MLLGTPTISATTPQTADAIVQRDLAPAENVPQFTSVTPVAAMAPPQKSQPTTVETTGTSPTRSPSPGSSSSHIRKCPPMTAPTAAMTSQV
jgi:hypothetical protein